MVANAHAMMMLAAAAAATMLHPGGGVVVDAFASPSGHPQPRSASTVHRVRAAGLSARNPPQSSAGSEFGSSRSDGGSSSSSRRRFLAAVPAITLGAVSSTQPMQLPPSARALDVDAFISSTLDSEECNPATSKKCVPKTKLTDDEALCKYGGPGKQRGDACVRAGMSTAGTAAGGVDAYGNVDRGTFVRCKREWKVVDGKYQKFDICE